ncbi:hypothetical protein BU24DRAFT_190346 [Aaosphaeria arxii CBS 175.79]|uniref:Zn(2)-C6 fungal-type domain-containing protein n=1 Tax=Aaosphaeria arxii CBS 175.79 TaxID=1450172 RepID=A0A6A5XSY0_9PLEO|nr:uncharacterized protein BU24DRAFT_190346 [Aaosphaeria arxii CBS 175.79]KAF2016026.1 hypothetical protein BU24DRAFT_190346 [Aaosphaeria arxii CBS 175.79]
MAQRQPVVSALGRVLASDETWADLVSWNDVEEIVDPLFQGGAPAITTTTAEDGFGSDYPIASFEQSFPSAPASIVDEPTFLDYTVSGAPSIIDGPSSPGRSFSWLSTSPSFSTTATSPAVGRNSSRPYANSLNALDDRPFSLRCVQDSPLLETEEQFLNHSFHSDIAYDAPFNPFLHGTSHTFNSLDVSSSQAFSNLGDWADQSQTIEPIPELDHARAIPIPHSSFSHSQGMQSAPRSSEQYYSSVNEMPAGIAIPRHRRAAPHGMNEHSPSWSQHVPPLLSVSPETRRRPRSTTMSRTSSRTEPRRSRNSLTTPSPTSNTFGWVSYRPNQLTNRLVASAAEGSAGRRQRGRTKALTVEQRQNAAIMRKIGACSNCQKRKEKCDRGTPCKSCLEHYKGDLINFPCRGRRLSNLSQAFLSERLGWHPTGRTLESFVAPQGFDVVSGIQYNIPVNFGFGPALHVPVHALQITDESKLYHQHVVYSWPPSNSQSGIHSHAILPAVIASGALPSITEVLDNHLSLLVTQHFRMFPLFCSPLRILKGVYIFFRSLTPDNAHSHLLRQALKLLVLVHIGGDITLPSIASDAVLMQLARSSLPPSAYSTEVDAPAPTPCFIRAQFGAAMPALASALMTDVLSALEVILLNRANEDWPVAIAVLITLLMTVESIHYHDARLPYHAYHDSAHDQPNQSSGAEARAVDDQSVEYLLEYYSACFSGCHSRLRPDWDGDAVQDKFIQGVRDAISDAGGYLEAKATGERTNEDMGFFFDRLVARLLILKI